MSASEIKIICDDYIPQFLYYYYNLTIISVTIVILYHYYRDIILVFYNIIVSEAIPVSMTYNLEILAWFEHCKNFQEMQSIDMGGTGRATYGLQCMPIEL